MAPIEPGDSGWPARKERLLERVHARGQALHRRAQVIRGLSVATALLLLVAVPGALAASGGGGGHRTVRVIGAPSTSTSEEPTTNTEPPTTTTATSPSTPAVRNTTTSLACRNSYDPACGPFRWDPDPGPNAPADVQVTYSPASPKPGEPVTFHIVMTDPDAPIGSDIRCDGNWTFGDGSSDPNPPCAYSCPMLRPRYGPWAPPAREPGRLAADVVHTYDTAGTFKASFRLRSGRPCEEVPVPYDSLGTAEIVVTVSTSTTRPPL